jgi:hypothetical protein
MWRYPGRGTNHLLLRWMGENGRAGFFSSRTREKRDDLFLPEVDIDDPDLGRVADQFEGAVDT